jgi:hypothetical protein
MAEGPVGIPALRVFGSIDERREERKVSSSGSTVCSEFYSDVG